MNRFYHTFLSQIVVKAFLFIAFFFVAIALKAQNEGATPYLNSTHTYRVTVGSTTNSTYEWDITNDDESIIRNLSSSLDWAEIKTLSGSNADIELIFTDSIFAATETWYLRFREISTLSGTCTARRRFQIDIEANEFYLTLDADQVMCKPIYDGMVATWDTTDVETYSSEITYRVTLNKEVSHTLTGWSFKGTVGFVPGNHTINSTSVAVVPVTEGTVTFTDDGLYGVDNDGIFHVAMGALTTATLTTVAVDVTVTIIGTIHSGDVVTLDLTNGIATSGSSAVITAIDNLDRPTLIKQPEILLRDRQEIVTIYGVPATHDIAFGADETAATAQNPMQNSTHKYTVLMENVGNETNSTTGWHIELASGGGPIVAGATTFDITPTYSATNGLASIIFYFDPDVEDEYVLYFTEENANGCSSVRPYPITIALPFDVDIAIATDDCSELSGTVNNPPLTVQPSTFEYVVSLTSLPAVFDTTWSFNFAISCPDLLGGSPTLSISEVLVSNVDGVVDYTVSNNDKITITKLAGTPVDRSVTLTVTYSSLYAANHDITATLTDGTISGSYNETDADDGVVIGDAGAIEGDINQAQHLIYRLPQPGALAGVD